MTMTVAQVKAAALAQLAGGANWVQHFNAVDSSGRMSPIQNPNSVKWDIYGALVMATRNEPNYAALDATYTAVEAAIPANFINRDMESYNDAANWAGIVALLT